MVSGYAQHDTIKHSDGAHAKGNIHTNTVEGFFALLCEEFAFRSNRAAMGGNDGQRAAMIVLGAEGKRLTYQTGTGHRAA